MLKRLGIRRFARGDDMMEAVVISTEEVELARQRHAETRRRLKRDRGSLGLH